MPGDHLGFLAAASEVVGKAHVLTDATSLIRYSTDWTGRFKGRSPAVLRPGSTEEIRDLLGAARAFGVSVALQGGNTSLSGGTVPISGEVICSLERMGGVEIDVGSGQATLGAGTTLSQLMEAARASGWDYGVDFASRARATIGGTIATNAGGMRVIAHGDTRAQLLGVTAVLGTAQVISHMGGLSKEATGYDLSGLLCGAEGTLGVVTAARVKLVRPKDRKVVALLAFDTLGSAVEAVYTVRGLRALAAAELFVDTGLELVCQTTGLPSPFESPHDAYLLIEVCDDTDPRPQLDQVLDSLGSLAQAAVGGDDRQAARLWRYREAHSEAIATIGVPHKIDVCVPLRALPQFVDVVSDLASRFGATLWLFGHAAEGNLHVNLTGLGDSEIADEEVLRVAVELGGSISAEHGIGTAKRRWLHLSRSPEELATFRALKSALDPDGVLNPSVLLGG
ncbi:MAG: FAD-binding oxidoreductase [Acidimicrobiales bacterium]